MAYPKGWVSRAAVLSRPAMPLKRLLRVVKDAENCSTDDAADIVDAWIGSGVLERRDDGKYYAVPGGG